MLSFNFCFAVLYIYVCVGGVCLRDRLSSAYINMNNFINGV